MLRNYFKIAWRNLIKNKGYTFINIGGLAVGMAVAIVIGLWIYEELSYNKSHENYNRIAQVMQNQTVNGITETWDALPFIMSEGLRNEYGSDFKYAVQGTWESQYTLGFGNKMFIKTGSYFEPEITEILSLNMINGVRNGLKEMHSILLSQSLSEVLFGKMDPVGEILKLENKVDVKVTGVYEDFSKNSSFKKLDFILPWDLYVSQVWWIKEGLDSTNPWGPGGSTRSYVQMAENTILEEVSLKIRDIITDKKSELDKAYEQEVFLHPMAKWHLYAGFENGNNIRGRIGDIWLFGIIGLFILLLACINFMNLSTARSEKRAKEVGIRKAIGSNRRQLISQFFIESILISMLAFVFSVFLVALILPFFNRIADSHVVILWDNLLFWVLGLAFSILIGIIAGMYPAIYLSSFKPVKVLKGVFKVGQSASTPRQVLVVSQFTISIMLIMGTIVIYQQINHAQNRPLGYEKDGLITVSTTEETHRNIDGIRLSLINEGAIIEMSESDNLITDEWNQAGGFEWDGKDSKLVGDFHIGSVNYDYGETIGWKIKEGRDFSRAFGTDSIQLILNESAVAFMNLKDPIGKILRNPGEASSVITIVGVVEDLLIESPYEPVKPYIFVNAKGRGKLSEFLIKLNPEKSVKESLGKIEAVFKIHNPSRPFVAKFVDEAYAQKFGNEKRISQLITLFAILAIFISCLGLFGLASYVAEQRTKEIGVRKVLGASVIRLWKMLSKDFIGLVIVACAIAVPVAYYIMDGWLQKFNYRTSISWWVSVLACGGAIIITLITVSYQAIRAAKANPIKSLKTE